MQLMSPFIFTIIATCFTPLILFDRELRATHRSVPILDLTAS